METTTNNAAQSAPKPISPASALSDIVVTRTTEDGANKEQAITFSPTPYSRGKKKESGIKFPYTGDITDESLPVLKDFLGNEEFFGLISEAWRIYVQQTYNAVLDELGGIFNAEKFANYIKTGSTRGETIEQLRTKVESIQTDLISLQAGLMNPATMQESLGKFMKLTTDLKALNNALTAKKRIKKTKTEETEESEDNTETPAPVNA